MGQKRKFSGRKRLRDRGNSRRGFEALEKRELLDGDGFELSQTHQVPVSEFLDQVDWSSSELNPSFVKGGPDLIFTPAIVGGSGSHPTNPDSPANAVDPNTAGGAFGGVASIKILIPGFPAPTPADPNNTTTQEFLCTGSVVSPTYVLTAGHCFDALDEDGELDPGTTAVVQLNDGDPAGDGNFSSTHDVITFNINDSFAGFGANFNDDVALLELATPVPTGTPMYAVTDSLMDPQQRINMVGYGLTGSGDTGLITTPSDPAFPSPEVKRQRQNVADIFVANDETIFIPGLGEFPLPPNEIFVFDFDGPTTVGYSGGTTLGNDVEGNIAPGDSGGPSFLMEAVNPADPLGPAIHLTTADGKLILGGINTFNGAFGFGGNPGEFVTESAPTGGLAGGIMLAPYSEWINSIIGVDIDLASDVTVAASSTPGLTEVTYELTVSNEGANDATGVVIAETTLDLPAGATVTSTPSTGSYGPSWDIGDLAAGASETLTIVVEFDPNAISAADPFDIAFEVGAVVEPDTDSSNDSVSDTVSLAVPLGATVSGSTWGVDAVPLNIGANATLSYINLNQISVTYAGPQASAPALQVFGPTDGEPEITATLASFDGVTANYSLPNLSQGYYKVVAAGDEIDFSIKPGDTNGSSDVNIFDFSVFLSLFQPGVYQGPAPIVADFNGTGTVDIFDFSIFLSFYTTDLTDFTPPQLPPPPPPPQADFASAAVLDLVWAEDSNSVDEDEPGRRRRGGRSRFA